MQNETLHHRSAGLEEALYRGRIGPKWLILILEKEKEWGKGELAWRRRGHFPLLQGDITRMVAAAGPPAQATPLSEGLPGPNTQQDAAGSCHTMLHFRDSWDACHSLQALVDSWPSLAAPCPRAGSTATLLLPASAEI